MESRELKPQGYPRWLPEFFAWLLAAAGMAGLYLAFDHGLLSSEVFSGRGASVGHVIRAYGTVRKARVPASEFPASERRLATGREILAALRTGEQVQTGEDSSAEILFHGGSILQLTAGTLVTFEEGADGEIALRLILGRAFLELSSESARFVFRKSDGTPAEIPPGKTFVLALNALASYDEAVEVRALEAANPAASATELEMRALAHGEEFGQRYAVLVPPVVEGAREPRMASKDRMAPVRAPAGVRPGQEANVAVNTLDEEFRWNPSNGPSEDPVTGYEFRIRPAFGYQVEDGARKDQVFLTKEPRLPMAKVGGAGVFLWSVRAITAGGKKGNPSAARWLELSFPRLLFAPEIKKPRVN